MDCTAQIQPWFYLCLALCGVILAMLAMFFGYNLKLGVRTAQLEKKNGKEQAQINELRKEIKQLKREKEWFEPPLPEENITFCPEPELPEEDDTIYCSEPICPDCEQEECICDERDEPEELEEVDHD